MKTYKKIVIILGIIVGCIVATLANLSLPAVKAAFTHTITQENYQVLKDYVFNVAKNSDIKSNEDIKITMELSEDSVVINADADLYGVKATFPISDLNWKIEDGIIKYDICSIDYNNVSYKEYTDVQPIWFYVVMSCALVAMIAFCVYVVFYDTPVYIFKNKKS